MTDKTVRIPIVIQNGKIELQQPAPLNLFPDELYREGAEGFLILDADSIHEDWAEQLNQDKTADFLPQGAIVYFSVNPNRVHDDMRQHLIAIPYEKIEISKFVRIDRRYVSVQVIEPLQINLRGTKSARLCPCSCVILSTGQKASSLNEAYKLIVEKYEPDRRSNAGNVFQLGLWQENEKAPYIFLDTRRQEIQCTTSQVKKQDA